MNSYIINSETKNKLVTLGCDIGVAVGVSLALDRHKIPPFDDGFRCTYGEFKEMLKRGYLVEISVPDLGAIMDLFNHYPTAKLEGVYSLTYLIMIQQQRRR